MSCCFLPQAVASVAIRSLPRTATPPPHMGGQCGGRDADFAAVCSRRQLSGRGTGERRWLSPEGASPNLLVAPVLVWLHCGVGSSFSLPLFPTTAYSEPPPPHTGNVYMTIAVRKAKLIHARCLAPSALPVCG